MAGDRHAKVMASVVSAVRTGTREAPADYLDRVRARAYTVTDEDVAGLLADGLSEDEVFEATLNAALDAALERLDAGLAAL